MIGSTLYSSGVSIGLGSSEARNRERTDKPLENISSTRTLDSRLHASTKQRQLKFFQTVNHAQVIWNPHSKPKGLLGGHLNIRSLLPKIDQMRKLLMESNLDFLCITESWLNCNVSTDRVNIPGYSCYRKDRTTGKVGYGGVLIYIRESFKCAQLSLDDLECLGINVILSHNMNFNIVVLYNPPGHDINLYNELKGLLSACDHFNETIFLGDYNVNWADKKAKTKLKAAMEKFKYKQLIDKATRITRKTETLIDLIFTNRPERVIKTYNLITGLSDHNMTLVVRKLSHKRLVHHDRTENKSSTTGIPRRNITNFDHDLMGVNWESITAELDLDASVNNFTSTMSNLINKHTKTWKSRPKKYSLPWFNQDILQLSKKRDLARKKSLMTKTITDHLLVTALRNKVVSEL